MTGFRFPQFPEINPNMDLNFYLKSIRNDVINKLATIEYCFLISESEYAIDIDFDYSAYQSLENNVAIEYAENYIQRFRVA